MCFFTLNLLDLDSSFPPPISFDMQFRAGSIHLLIGFIRADDQFRWNFNLFLSKYLTFLCDGGSFTFFFFKEGRIKKNNLLKILIIFSKSLKFKNGATRYKCVISRYFTIFLLLLSRFRNQFIEKYRFTTFRNFYLCSLRSNKNSIKEWNTYWSSNHV